MLWDPNLPHELLFYAAGVHRLRSRISSRAPPSPHVLLPLSPISFPAFPEVRHPRLCCAFHLLPSLGGSDLVSIFHSIGTIILLFICFMPSSYALLY
eukprot:1760663-Pleurochrysis_carterae.AAC.2